MRRPDATNMHGVRQEKRVHRGGSFLCTDQYFSRCMMGTRGKGDVRVGMIHLGFRCVMSVDPANRWKTGGHELRQIELAVCTNLGIKREYCDEPSRHVLWGFAFVTRLRRPSEGGSGRLFHPGDGVVHLDVMAGDRVRHWLIGQ